jgi:hypothetical protein
LNRLPIQSSHDGRLPVGVAAELAQQKHRQAGDSPHSLRIIGFNLLAFDFFARVPGFRWGI